MGSAATTGQRPAGPVDATAPHRQVASRATLPGERGAAPMRSTVATAHAGGMAGGTR